MQAMQVPAAPGREGIGLTAPFQMGCENIEFRHLGEELDSHQKERKLAVNVLARLELDAVRALRGWKNIKNRQ